MLLKAKWSKEYKDKAKKMRLHFKVNTNTTKSSLESKMHKEW